MFFVNLFNILNLYITVYSTNTTCTVDTLLHSSSSFYFYLLKDVLQTIKSKLGISWNAQLIKIWHKNIIPFRKQHYFFEKLVNISAIMRSRKLSTINYFTLLTVNGTSGVKNHFIFPFKINNDEWFIRVLISCWEIQLNNKQKNSSVLKTA